VRPDSWRQHFDSDIGGGCDVTTKKGGGIVFVFRSFLTQFFLVDPELCLYCFSSIHPSTYIYVIYTSIHISMLSIYPYMYVIYLNIYLSIYLYISSSRGPENPGRTFGSET
jgi:hypothetical protein